MAQHLAVLLCMTALLSVVSAASVGPASAPNLFKLRSNLKTYENSLAPSGTKKMKYFTSRVNADEELLCLRMRFGPCVCFPDIRRFDA